MPVVSPRVQAADDDFSVGPNLPNTEFVRQVCPDEHVTINLSLEPLAATPLPHALTPAMHGPFAVDCRQINSRPC